MLRVGMQPALEEGGPERGQRGAAGNQLTVARVDHHPQPDLDEQRGKRHRGEAEPGVEDYLADLGKTRPCGATVPGAGRAAGASAR